MILEALAIGGVFSWLSGRKKKAEALRNTVTRYANIVTPSMEHFETYEHSTNEECTVNFDLMEFKRKSSFCEYPGGTTWRRYKMSLIDGALRFKLVEMAAHDYVMRFKHFVTSDYGKNPKIVHNPFAVEGEETSPFAPKPEEWVKDIEEAMYKGHKMDGSPEVAYFLNERYKKYLSEKSDFTCDEKEQIAEILLEHTRLGEETASKCKSNETLWWEGYHPVKELTYKK